jgi:hypothetical protein
LRFRLEAANWERRSWLAQKTLHRWVDPCKAYIKASKASFAFSLCLLEAISVFPLGDTLAAILRLSRAFSTVQSLEACPWTNSGHGLRPDNTNAAPCFASAELCRSIQRLVQTSWGFPHVANVPYLEVPQLRPSPGCCQNENDDTSRPVPSS